MSDKTKSVEEKAKSVEERSRERNLPPEAQRALAEAEERRRLAKLAAEKAPPRPKELNGPGGLDPTRYGDWERKGIASDF
jgi:hypothetical protein